MHRAHFPEVYQGVPAGNQERKHDAFEDAEEDLDEDEEDEESKDVVDWKYEHPRHLTGAAKAGEGVIEEGGESAEDDEEEDEDSEEDYRF